LIGLSVFLAWLTWRFVERHARAPRHADRKSWALSRRARQRGCRRSRPGAERRLAGRASVARYEAKAHDLRGPASSGRGVPCAVADAAAAPALLYCLQTRQGPPTAALLGDSHADQLFDGLAQADSVRNWLLIGHPATPPLLDVRTRLGGEDGDRQARAEKAIRGVASKCEHPQRRRGLLRQHLPARHLGGTGLRARRSANQRQPGVVAGGLAWTRKP
jgi:hypothetical protein